MSCLSLVSIIVMICVLGALIIFNLVPGSRAEAACGRVCHADPSMTPEPYDQVYTTRIRGAGS